MSNAGNRDAAPAGCIDLVNSPPLVQRQPEVIPGGQGRCGTLDVKLVTTVGNNLRQGRVVEQQAEAGHRDRTSLRAHLTPQRAEPATGAFQEHPPVFSP